MRGSTLHSSRSGASHEHSQRGFLEIVGTLADSKEVVVDFDSRAISPLDAKYISLALQHKSVPGTDAVFTTTEHDKYNEVNAVIADAHVRQTNLEQSVLELHKLYKGECPLPKF